VNTADSQLSPGATDSVTALYAEHALGLVRLAVVLTGDRAAAEDIVQDAFLGLYRRWDKVADMAAPPGLLAGQCGQRLPDGAAAPLAAELPASGRR
jgi:DNA-directed RNA polymerase specialized sigma24 family protein